MIILKKFNKTKHLKILNAWLYERKVSSQDKESIAKTGYIVYFNELPVCTGFIRRIEGGYGMIDGYATNPMAASIIKHICMGELTDKLIERGKELKLKALTGWTKDKSIIDRALAHGFIQSDQAVIVINLSQGSK